MQAATWTDLKGIMLSEGSQSPVSGFHVLFSEGRSDGVVSRGEGWGRV